MNAILAVAIVAALVAADPPVDPELAAGIKQVEEGDYTGAIVTLDGAASALRLSKDVSRARDLAQAYLYLGIAYVGLGHETSAKAKFREALSQSGELSLSPKQFPPKVIELFEVAKEEGRPAVAAAPAKEKKGGSKKGLVFGGLGVLAVGGGVLAVSGGKQEAPAEPDDPREFLDATGSLTQYSCRDFRLVARTSGTLDATLTWTDNTAVAALTMKLYEEGFNEVARSNPSANLEAKLSASVTNQIYTLSVCQGGHPNPVTFSLNVRYP
jgi:hypothetical protein